MIDLLKAAWPFISEIFFKGKTLKDIVLKNKMACLLLFALFISATVNYVTLSKLWEIAVLNRKEKTVSTQKEQTTELVVEPPKKPNLDQEFKCKPPSPEDDVRKRLQAIYKD